MESVIKLVEGFNMRRSIRNFKPGAEISGQQIKLLLEAAMMAPSASNTRPWEFYVIKSRNKLDELAAAHPYAKMLTTASLAIIVCALPETQRDLASGFFPQDCAAATQNILIQASAMGLGSCWCGVYPKEQRMAEVRHVLDITNREDIIPFNIIALGFPDSIPNPRGFYEADKVIYI
jgi:nitroreductase